MTEGNLRSVRLEWTGSGLLFRGGGTTPTTPVIEIDGDNSGAPGPMLTLLLAAAGCTGADAVQMLEKMRVKLATLVIEIDGVRRDENPRRYDAIHLRYCGAGEGIDHNKLDRAVSLSLEKYCSVMNTLASDVAVSYDVVVKEEE